MPTAQSAARRGPDVARMLFVAALVLVPLAMDYGGFFYGDTVFAKAALAQVLVYTSASILLLSWLKGSFECRFQGIQVLALGLMLWVALAAVSSPYWSTAIIGTTKRQEGALTAVAYLIAFVLGARLLNRSGHLRLVLRAVSVSGAVVAAYGLVQFLGVDPLSWQFAWSSNRSFGTMSNPDFFGGYVALTCFLSIGLGLSSTESKARWTWWSLAFLQGFTAVTSFSRGAWIALAVGALVFAVLLARTRPRLSVGMRPQLSSLQKYSVIGLLTLAAFGIAWLSLGSGDQGMSRRFADVVDPNSAVVRGRVELGRVALLSAADRPLLGYGPDTLALVAGPKATQALASLVEPGAGVDSAHNMLLQAASELGLPGFAMLVALITWASVASWRLCVSISSSHPRSALLVVGGLAGCAASLTNFMFNPTNVGGTLVFWGVLGAIVSPVGATGPFAPRPKGAGPFAAGALVITLLCAASVVPLVAAARTAAVLDDPTAPPSEQLAAALRAARLNPLSADYRSGAAKAEADLLVETVYSNPGDRARISGLLQASLEHAQEATNMQPETGLRRNMQTGLLLLGGQYVDQAFYVQARDAASDTVEDMPFELTARYWYARALYESGDEPGAEATLTSILSIRPAYPEAALFLADILANSGRTSLALEVLVRADPAGSDPQIQQVIESLRKDAAP